MANFKIFVLIIICIPSFLFSQEYYLETIEIEEIEETDADEDDQIIVDVPFAVIEKVPLYPGCSGENNSELKKCTSDKISSFMKKKMKKKKLSKNLKPNTYKIYSTFKINEKGEIENIIIKAPDDIIEQEIFKVFKKMPTLTPGQHRGEVVRVLYSLPIIFQIDQNHNFSFL